MRRFAFTAVLVGGGLSAAGMAAQPPAPAASKAGGFYPETAIYRVPDLAYFTDSYAGTGYGYGGLHGCPYLHPYGAGAWAGSVLYDPYVSPPSAAGTGTTAPATGGSRLRAQPR